MLGENKHLATNVIVSFASKRHNSLNFPYMKENGELLMVAVTSGLRISEAGLACYEDFYLRAKKFCEFFPQYYRFTLGIALELEDLGMQGTVAEELCEYVIEHNLYQFETSDSRRMEILNLLGRRNYANDLENIYGQSLEGRVLDFMSRPQRFVTFNRPLFYELTHYIFYLTDFGKKQCELPESVYACLNNVGNLALLDNDTDLLAEICICFHFLGRTPHVYWEQHIQSAADAFVVTLEKDTEPDPTKLTDDYHDYLMINWLLAYTGKPCFMHEFSGQTPYFYKPECGRSVLSELSSAHYAHTFQKTFLSKSVKQDISVILSEDNREIVRQLTRTTSGSRELIDAYCGGIFVV